MQTKSLKAKGRRLQQWVRDEMLKNSTGLTPDDIRSTSMGAQGEDIQLSQLARTKWPFSIECKSKAAFAFYRDLGQAYTNAPEGTQPILVCKADYKPAVVIVDAEWFFETFGEKENV